VNARNPIAVRIAYRCGRRGIPSPVSFRRWVELALSHRRGGRRVVEIALLDVRAARALNRQHRGRDYATNVLSYPCDPLPGDRSGLLGDLVICPRVVAREAREQGKLLGHHYAHLVIHGVLHLVGYDHENEPEATVMEALEVKLLAKLGIADPYR
jgi:probable rRNA maturation factor